MVLIVTVSFSSLLFLIQRSRNLRISTEAQLEDFRKSLSELGVEFYELSASTKV